MGYIHISLQNMVGVNKKRKLDDLDDLFASSDEEPTMTGTRIDIPELLGFYLDFTWILLVVIRELERPNAGMQIHKT